MKKVVVVPIDDRPCHNELVIEAMGNMDSYILVYPPKEALGHFTRSGDVSILQSFLIEECHDADVLIIAMDALLYGGLVQARQANPSHDTDNYLESLNILRTIKKINSNIEILAYSVIMRLTTTVTDSNALDVWTAIFEYSQNVHKLELGLMDHLEFENHANKIPQDALDTYLAARKRNHSMNLECIKLCDASIIDYLVLVQEDTSKYGMHLKEQAVLRDEIKKRNIESKSTIKNGTDEMVALLLARVINQTNPTILTLDTTFIDHDFVALYEDKPALDNLKESLKVSKIEVGESDCVAILTPQRDKPIDHCFETRQNPQDYKSFYHYITKYSSKTYGVLDIFDANGGDVSVLEGIVDVLGYDGLKAYSAWNTASNAIGSFLLDMSIAYHKKTNPIYLKHRILDDAYYQGEVRHHVNRLMKECGMDVWGSNPNQSIDHELTNLINNALRDSAILKDKKPIKAHLPWGRSFEIEIEEG